MRRALGGVLLGFALLSLAIQMIVIWLPSSCSQDGKQRVPCPYQPGTALITVAEAALGYWLAYGKRRAPSGAV